MNIDFETILTQQDLHRLGIPISCLPIQTGPFPQLAGQIKESFSDLPSLKRLLIENSLCHLYQSAVFPLPLKVVIFTWVIGDGLGDFSAQIETAKTLSKNLPPSSEISLVSLHPSKMPLPALPLPFSQFLIPYEEDPKELGLFIPQVTFPETVLNTLKSAHVILQIPTYFPQTKELLSQVLHKRGPSYELIGEGGWGDTPRFNPLSGSRSLGLHFWEKGLFFPELSEHSSLQELCDPFLQKALASYQKKDKLCLAYLRNHTAAKALLSTLLRQTKEDPSDLFLCLFPCEGLISELPSLSQELQKCGIKEIHIFYEDHFTKIPIHLHGKILKVIQTKKCTRKDYQILLTTSNTLTGCRGDGSLAETLSAGKLPFLDFPEHKKPLLEGLIRVSQHFLSKKHPTSQYLEEFLQEPLDIEKTANLAKNPNTQSGFQQISLILKKQYRVDDFITNLTLRKAYHHFYPHIELLEKVSLDSFLFGDKSAFEVLKEIKSEIDIISH